MTFLPQNNQQFSEYGEQRVGQPEPYIQAVATYNKIPANFREFIDTTAGPGSVVYANREFAVSCTSTVASFGVLRSFRSINYRSGFGALIKFQARFTAGVALTQQAAGGFNIGDELTWGYNGADFGVFHRYGGLAEVQELQVTSTPGAGENCTLTLDGTAYSIPLTSSSVQTNAREIAAYLRANQSQVSAYANNDDVRITWLSDGPKAGAMSFASATATATLTQITGGVTKTTDHVASGSFNGDLPDSFDPTAYNSYKITYGAQATFWVQENTNGRWYRAHTIRSLNTRTAPLLGDKSLRLGLYAFNLGGGSGVTVHVDEISGFIEGAVQPIRNPRAEKNTVSVTTTELPIITIRNVETIMGVANQVEIEPRKISLANAGSRQSTFRLVANATLTGAIFQYENEDQLVSEIDRSATAVSGGTEITEITLSPGSSEVVDLDSLRIRIPPSLSLTVTAVQNAGGAAGNQTAALTWYEDV